jgi:hypothetical protein
MDKLEQSFSVLIDLNDPSKIINKFETYETLRLCLNLVNLNQEKMSFINLTISKNYHQILANLFCYIESIKSNINFDECTNIFTKSTNFQDRTLSEQCVLILIFLDKLFNQYFLLSIELRRFFSTINPIYNKTYLSCFISFIDDTNFIDNFIKCFKSFDGFINTIQNLSVSADECKNVWQETKAVDILLKFASNYQKFSIESYAVVAYIASDEDLERMTIISEIISKFANLAIKCIDDTGKIKYDQEFKDVDNKNKIFYISAVSLGNGFDLSIDVLLLSLFYFAINEKLKFDIYNNDDLKQSLKKIIYTGLDVEKHFAIQLLSQLAFNNQVREDIKLDLDFINYIESIKEKDLKFIRLKKSCENILWILKEENKPYKKIEAENIKQNKHIMISYNSASRQICLKIKSELEKNNFKVWIDVEEIHGSSLDSMARAVEQAECVLMCVTEKYRQSVNCKSEAEYASKLHKKVIPIILEKGYEKVTGWLGILMGTKIFVDFCKHDFDTAIQLLIKQIKLLNDDKILNNISLNENVKPVTEMNSINNTNNKIFNNNSNLSNLVGKMKHINIDEPKNWDFNKVRECLESKNLHKIYQILSDQIDGKLLYQLYEMKVYTPEFYYKSLTKNDLLDMKMVIDLSKLLSDLFEKDK